MSIGKILALIAVCCTLSSCGMKGSLYYEDDMPEKDVIDTERQIL